MAACLAVSGVLTYVYLALPARALPAAEYADFGAYWSLALVVGFGVFLPLEVELTRLLHDRPAGSALPRGTVGAAALLTGLSAAVLLAGWPLLSPALGGRTGLLLALLAVCAVSGGQFLLRGLLMARGAAGRYGAVLVADGALRVAGAAAVAALVDPPSVEAFGWTLVAALALAHLPLLARLLRARPGPATPPAPRPRLALADLGHLVVAALCAQALLNAAPVLVTGAAEPDERALAAAFVAAFTLVRLPLFVVVPLQSALIRPLATVGASGDRGRLRRLLLGWGGLVAAAAGVAAVVGALAGPPVVALLFGPRYVLPGADVAVLAAGSVVHLGLLVTSQALVAGGRHRDSAIGWVVGLVAAAVLFWVVPGLVPRAALAFAGGSAAALAWTASVLFRSAGADGDGDGATARREEPR
jgi:O-antigen/teichoic acid export membrane protein